MNRLRVHLSVQISLFVEKDEEEAGEKKKYFNNAIFHPISLLENGHSQTTAWSLGVLGFYPIGFYKSIKYKIDT